MYCLNDIKFDSCVDLKSKIVEEPNFEIFDKLQEILFNVRNFILDITHNLEKKIDKAESLYLSRYDCRQLFKISEKLFRPKCDNTMKLKQLSNVIQSAMSVTSSIKRKFQNYIAAITSRKIPQPPPDFSKEIAQAGFSY